MYVRMYLCIYIRLKQKSPFSVLALYKHFNINDADRNFKKTQL